MQVSIGCHLLHEAFLSTPLKSSALLACPQSSLHLAVRISSLKSLHFISEGRMKCHRIVETTDQDRFPCCMFPSRPFLSFHKMHRTCQTCHGLFSLRLLSPEQELPEAGTYLPYPQSLASPAFRTVLSTLKEFIAVSALCSLRTHTLTHSLTDLLLSTVPKTVPRHQVEFSVGTC